MPWSSQQAVDWVGLPSSLSPNSAAHPLSSLAGLVEHTSRAVWASLNKSPGKQIERVAATASTRRSQGVEAVKSSTPEQRQAVLDEWERLESHKDERKERMEQDVKKWAIEMEKAGKDGESLKADVVEGEAMKGGVEVEVKDLRNEEPTKEGAVSKEDPAKKEATAEEAAERRGYERAMAELAAKKEGEQ